MRRLMLAGLLAAALAGSTARADVPPALRGVKTIVCLGDSITQQGEAPGGYVWLVRRALQAIYPEQGIEVLNAGISGHKSNDMLARFDRDVLAKKPDLVTISVGVNDVWHGFYDNHPLGDGPRGVPLADYRRNVEEMVTRARSAGARVVILSTTVISEAADTPENAKLQAYNAALRRIARKSGARFVDFQNAFRAIINPFRAAGARGNLLTTDGVHMNAAGNSLMAHVLLGGLGVPLAARAAVKD